MEMHNANGERNVLQVKLSQQETEEIVLQKYKKTDTHQRKEKRK